MLKGFVSGVEKDIKRIPMKGQNLFDDSKLSPLMVIDGSKIIKPTTSAYYYDIFSGTTGLNTNVDATKSLKLEAGIYTLSRGERGGSVTAAILFLDATTEQQTTVSISNLDSPVTFSCANGGYLTIRYDVKNECYFSNIMLNLGSVALPYEPYGMQPGWEVRDQQGNILWGRELVHYGFKIDKTNDNSDTAVTYTYDAVTMTPAAMNFTTGVFDYGSWANAWFVRDAYPVALNLDGTEAYRLDPDDYTKKTDGTASDIQFVLLTEEPSDWSTQWKQYYTKDANDNYELNAQSEAPTFTLNTYYRLSYGGFQGNFMVAFPRVYFRRTEDATYNYVEISNHKLGDDWYAYAHINSSGNEVKRIYLPLFKGVIVDSKLRSVPGVIPQGGTTATAEVTAATACGSRWQIWDHSSAELINDLLILMSKSIDSQGKFGKGRESGYNSSDTVTYGKLQTGTLVKGGKFKGFSSSYKEVKVFGIEGFWANRWDRLQGMLLVNNVWKIKMTPPYNFTGTDFVTLSNASVPTGNGYLSKVQTSEYGSIPASIDGGSSTKYFKDYFYKTATDTRVALLGGGCGSGVLCGFRYVYVGNIASSSYWGFGASPVYK